MKLRDILLEMEGMDTFQMYHGGKRWSRIPTELKVSNKGRYEAGVGIYFTNDYNTARKYAKGSRVVHLVDIAKNFKELNDIHIPLKELTDFVKNLGGLRKKQEIIQTLVDYSTRTKRGLVPINILNNLIVNYGAGGGGVGVKISNFFVSKGADAHVENQGGGEFWVIIFNPQIIKKVSVIDPKIVGSDFPFLLPKIEAQ